VEDLELAKLLRVCAKRAAVGRTIAAANTSKGNRGISAVGEPYEPNNKGPCVQAILQALNTHT
jgi:hypothetical protein